MDRTSKQKKNRPILTPSRSSHGRMQFAGFGCGPPPPPKRKNIPKSERSKVLQEAEQLVRVMASKDDGKDRDAAKKVIQQPNVTSDKYKFMLEKPWRTGHAFHEEDEPPNAHVKEKIEKFKTKNPKSFTVETTSTTSQIRDVQPTMVHRTASHEVEKAYADLAPSNDSLGFQEDFIEDAKESKQISTTIAELNQTIEQLKQDHQTELKRVADENEKLLRSAQEALEQAQISARVKMSSLERKLADITKRETHRQDAEQQLQSKYDSVENQLAQVELDRRMEVSSLQKKLSNAEDQLIELRQQFQTKNEELEVRLHTSLEQQDEQHRRREVHSEAEIQILRYQNEQLENELSDLQREYENLTNKQNDLDESMRNDSSFLILQNTDLASKITQLEEASVYAEAQHMEALDKVLEEKENIAKQLEILRQDRDQLRMQIGELSSPSANNLPKSNSESNIDIERTTKIGEVWERLSEAETKLDSERSKVLHLEQENSALSKQLKESKRMALASLEPNTALKETIETLENKLASTTAELNEAKSKQSELFAQNQRIENELAENEQSFKVESVKKDIKISDMESNVKVLEKLLNDSKRKLEQTIGKSVQLDQVQKQLEAKERQLAEMTQNHEELERDLEELTRQEKQGRMDLSEARDRHCSEAAEFEAEISRCNSRIEELQKEVSTLMPVSHEVGRVKMALHEATEELKLSESNNQTLNEQIQGLQSEIASMNSKVRDLEMELDHANRRHEETTTQLLHLETAQAKEQEVLSEELRESETTIACLMEELDMHKSIAQDLERTEEELKASREKFSALERNMQEIREQGEREVSSLQSRLNDSNQQVIELREQLLPMTKELQQARREIEGLQQQLTESTDGGAAREALKMFEKEIASLRCELEDSAMALELSENQLASFRQDKDKEFKDINQQIANSRETIVQLQSEVNLLRPKVVLLERKEQECASMAADLAAKAKQVDMCRLQLLDMEEDRNYNRARIAELDDLLHKNGSSHSLLENKANEVARLKAERDTLKQKLSVVEAFATALEEDNNQKKQLVHEMMSKSGDLGGSSTGAVIESLQKDLERTLKRCADLSLQLADSQFHIDNLTEELRRSKKGNASDTSTNRGFRRSGSYDSPSRSVSRKSITSMFANSISAMDESIRGVAGLRSDDSTHGKNILP